MISKTKVGEKSTSLQWSELFGGMLSTGGRSEYPIQTVSTRDISKINERQVSMTSTNPMKYAPFLETVILKKASLAKMER